MRIAIADDDNDVISFVRGIMLRSGHSCAAFRNGVDLLTALRRDTFDLVMLDWNMPGESGFDLLRQIRATIPGPIGIIMLTSRADTDDITGALRAGADDYIIKPENAAVIAARVEAVLRRAVPAKPSERFAQFDGYRFDRLTEAVEINDTPVPLSSKEFTLALLFFENPHRAMSRGYLLETVWQSVADLPTRTLDMHVSKIRAKLHLRPENGYRIVALSGYGYRMERFSTGNA